MNRSTPSSLAALLLAAGALGVAGCQPAQVGAAAVVDGRSIRISDLQRTVQEIRVFQEKAGVTAQSPNTLARDELQRELIYAVHQRAARDLGVTVTGNEIDQQVVAALREAGGQQRFEQQVAGVNLTLGLLDDFVRQRLLRQKIGEALVPAADSPQRRSEQTEKVTERLVATAKQMDFVVNPRFGDFDPNTGAIVDHLDDFLLPPKAEQQSPGQAPGQVPGGQVPGGQVPGGGVPPGSQG